MTEYVVGDVVRVVKNEADPEFDKYIGQLGTVTGVFDLEKVYRLFPLTVVMQSDYQELGYFEDELEPNI